jgi:hypothetical protein
MARKEIVVVQSGWVLIGDVTETSTSVNLSDAGVVRVWGTTRGLGELALNGLTSETIIDPCGEATIPLHAVLFRLEYKA